MFLTPEETARLTGAKFKKKQIEWLQRNGVKYMLNCLGQPVVLVSTVEKRLGGPTQPAPWRMDESKIA